MITIYNMYLAQNVMSDPQSFYYRCSSTIVSIDVLTPSIVFAYFRFIIHCYYIDRLIGVIKNVTNYLLNRRLLMHFFFYFINLPKAERFMFMVLNE